MRIITLDDDVFGYVAAHMRDFEDTPSKILRRLLDIDRPGSRVRRTPRPGRAKRPAVQEHELTAAIDGAPWLPFDVHRYLYLIKCTQQLRPFDFRHVLKLKGRTRRYFANSAEEIEASGKATQPRSIPGSSYWALTNIPTREKQRILRNMFTMLGFSEDAMLGAREYLARGRIPTMPT